MLFVFNKNKIISYTVATSIVILLFIFSISLIPNSDVRIVQISTNAINGMENENMDNNILNSTDITKNNIRNNL